MSRVKKIELTDKALLDLVQSVLADVDRLPDGAKLLTLVHSPGLASCILFIEHPSFEQVEGGDLMLYAPKIRLKADAPAWPDPEPKPEEVETTTPTGGSGNKGKTKNEAGN